MKKQIQQLFDSIPRNNNVENLNNNEKKMNDISIDNNNNDIKKCSKLYKLSKQLLVKYKNNNNKEKEKKKLFSKLRDIYGNIILDNPKYALQKNVMHKLWMLYYDNIDSCHKLINNNNNNNIYERELSHHLDVCTNFFRKFAEKIAKKYHISDMSTLFNNEDKIIMSIKPILCATFLALGDTGRYCATYLKETHNNDENWKKIVNMYNMALICHPFSGQAYNQLAVVALKHDQDYFDALYYYMRSLSCGLYSFPAYNNIVSLFNKNQENWKQKKYENLDELYNFKLLFVYVQGLLNTKINLDEYDDKFNELMKYFDQLLSNNLISEKLALYIIVMCIYTITNMVEWKADKFITPISLNDDKLNINSIVFKYSISLLFIISSKFIHICAIHSKELPYGASVILACWWIGHYPQLCNLDDKNVLLFQEATTLLLNNFETLSKYRNENMNEDQRILLKSLSGFSVLPNLSQWCTLLATQTTKINDIIQMMERAASTIKFDVNTNQYYVPNNNHHHDNTHESENNIIGEVNDNLYDVIDDDNEHWEGLVADLRFVDI